jgi:flagellar hook assembly protein FlgD
VVRPDLPAGPGLTISPNPFSPDGDGFEDETALGYRTNAASILLRVRLFDMQGKEVRSLVGSEYRTGAGIVVWDGAGESGMKVGIGIYVVLFESVDAESGEEYSVKTTVVVGGRLE